MLGVDVLAVRIFYPGGTKEAELMLQWQQVY